MTIQTPVKPVAFFDVSTLSLVQKTILIIAGTLVLALASQVSVPMVPVPVTMQTFAVTMIGALYGWRLGTLTVLTWLGEALIGLPVLAGMKFGIAPFIGPTAGYLIAFPLMAALVGYVTQRGVSGHRWAAGFMLHLVANLLCLALGWLWLAALIGAEKAWIGGVLPFLIGAALKSALAAAIMKGLAVRSEKSA